MKRCLGLVLSAGFLLCCVSPHSSATHVSRTAVAQQIEGQASASPALITAQTGPDDAQSLAHLGLLEAQQQHYSAAIDLYRHAMAKDPRLPGLELNLALAYFKNSQFADALPLFSNELQRHPGDDRLTILVGMTHYGMGDYLVAIPYLQRGAERDSTSLPLWLTLAHSCLWAKQQACVMSAYKQILAINPGSAEAEMLIGEALDDSGNDAAAIQHFRAAVVANPREPNAHFGLGYLLWTTTHYSEAASEFSDEIAINPNHGQAEAYLGDCLLQLKQLEPAERHLRAALVRDPDSELSHRDLGIIEAELGRSVDAERELRHALALAPADSSARWHLAKVLQSDGRKEEAATEFHLLSTMKKEENDNLMRKMEQQSRAFNPVR
jgi:tetratricopeptide (TPR) repeat protein